MTSYNSVPNSTSGLPPWDDDNSYTPYSQRPETYIVPLVFFVIFIVGVLGNGTLVVIFLKHRAMRNAPNTYILSLALADLLVIVTCVPFTSTIYTVASWPWGSTLCKISETAKCISIGVSVFTLTALSIERYCAIVNPLRRLQNKSLTIVTAASIWIVASILALPDAFQSHLMQIQVSDFRTISVCIPYPEGGHQKLYAKYSAALKALIYYLLPLAIISSVYVLMARRLHASTKEMPGEIQGQSAVQSKARKHVARMVLSFVFLFFLCFFPHHVFMLWFTFWPRAEDDYNDFWHAFKILGFCLSFINSCVNPVALYCVSASFRHHIRYYLCCAKGALTQNVNDSSFHTRRSMQISKYKNSCF